MATDSKMQIEYIKLEQIKPYERNPRKNDDAVKYVKQSIKEFGFKVPIVLDKDNVIVAGHTRYKASKELGLKEVPCIHADDLNGEQIKAFRLADNKVSEFAEWDDSLLNLELDSLEMDMTDFGFLDSVFEEEQKEIIEDEVSEDVEPLCKLGDVWQLGNHRLMCGDATNENDVEKLTGGVQIDLVFTDPPYNTGMVKNNNHSTRLSGMFNDSYTDEEWENFMESFCKMYNTKLKENGVAYICLDWRRNYQLIPHIKKYFKLSNTIVWDKVVHGLGSDYKYTYELINVCKKGNPIINSHQGDKEYQDVWHIQRKIGKDEEHATKKPLELCGRAIKHASKEKDLVLDLFGGSGSTLIACEQLNRKCYMMELDPHYCDVIINRWETLTGDKATLLESK